MLAMLGFSALLAVSLTAPSERWIHVCCRREVASA